MVESCSQRDQECVCLCTIIPLIFERLKRGVKPINKRQKFIQNWVLKLVCITLKIIFYYKRFYFLMEMDVYQVCAGAHRGQSEKDIRFSGIRIIGSCEALCGCWELTLSPL